MKNDTTFVRMRSDDHLGDAKMSKRAPRSVEFDVFINGVYSSKWRPAARAKGGGHSQTRGLAGVTEMSGSTVLAA